MPAAFRSGLHFVPFYGTTFCIAAQSYVGLAGVVKTMNSVRKALQVLESVADGQPIGVSQLAAALRQPKSSVQRALETLHEAGWIRPSSGERTRWELTFRASRLARKAGSHFGLREAAMPHMEELRRATGETIHLAVFDDTEMVLIERLESTHPVRHVEPLGGRASMLVTATGKSILARLPRAEVASMHAVALERRAAGSAQPTLPQLETLLAELDAIAERGYATTSSWRDGVFATGVAICDQGQRPVAGLSISVPASRSSDDARALHARLLLEHVVQISEKLQ